MRCSIVTWSPRWSNGRLPLARSGPRGLTSTGPDIPARRARPVAIFWSSAVSTPAWTALHAAQHNPGRRIVLVEADRIGWAASGRNGGFVDGRGRDEVCRRRLPRPSGGPSHSSYGAGDGPQATAPIPARTVGQHGNPGHPMVTRSCRPQRRQAQRFAAHVGRRGSRVRLVASTISSRRPATGCSPTVLIAPRRTTHERLRRQ
jgi:hypothetical protein